MKAASLLAAVLLVATPALLRAADWVPMASPDGKVTMLVPGEAEERELTKNILGMTFTTNVKRFRTDDVVFDLTYTPLSPMIIDFAGPEGIYKNTKGKVMQEAMGKERSFENFTVDGHAGKLLRYDMVHPTDPSHKGFEGLSLMLVLDDALYVANGIVKKASGMADIEKFENSIKVKS